MSVTKSHMPVIAATQLLIREFAFHVVSRPVKLYANNDWESLLGLPYASSTPSLTLNCNLNFGWEVSGGVSDSYDLTKDNPFLIHISHKCVA